MTAPADGERQPNRITLTLPSWTADLRDPGIQAIVILLVPIVAAFVLLGFAWRGVARTLFVPLQLPWMVSCGLGAFALIFTGLAAMSIHIGRRDDAAHRAASEALLRDALELADDVASGRRTLPSRGRRRRRS